VYTAPLDPDENKVLCPPVLFQDLMGDARKRTVDAGLVEDQRFFL
jgi:hypothetical protein